MYTFSSFLYRQKQNYQKLRFDLQREYLAQNPVFNNLFQPTLSITFIKKMRYEN